MQTFKYSIIVLSYNELNETTRPCIKSVLENTLPDSYELILVDNNSKDGTPAFLQEMADEHPNIKLCLNNINKGYSGGNNDGLRLVTGEFVVLLNNDTLVPPDWLENLIKPFYNDSQIGMVGPVTNSAGNEQRVQLEGLDEVNYACVAGEYTRGQNGVWFETEKLGFYCVAMRRALVEKIGYLDEKFGIGMFEDDDYCVRARRAGYKLVVAEDCFVYHKGSISFKKLDSDSYLDLFEQNRSYYFLKNQIVWTYSDISKAIWMKLKMDLSELESTNSSALERVKARSSIMSDALNQLHYVEISNATIQGQSMAHRIVEQKQQELMEMSEWATGLKQQNEKLINDVVVKQHELLKMSDWATGLKLENENLSIDVAGKQQELVKMSDWATGLKIQNENLTSNVAGKHQELMEMSNWATNVNTNNKELSIHNSDLVAQLNLIKLTWWYRLSRLLRWSND